ESVFFVAQFLSVYFWGRASDSFGRRPILLLAPLGQASSLVCFGWSKSDSVRVMFRSALGVFQGNTGNVSEQANGLRLRDFKMTDVSTLAYAMSFISIAWSLGSTLGPILGQHLSNPAGKWPEPLGQLRVLHENPNLLPCGVVGLLSLLCFLIGYFGLKELTNMILQSSPAILECQKVKTLVTPASTESAPTTLLVAEVCDSYGSISVTKSSSRTIRNSSVVEDAMTLSKVRDILTPRLLTALFNYGFFSIVQTAYLLILLPLTYPPPQSAETPNFFPDHQIFSGVLEGIRMRDIGNIIIQMYMIPRLFRLLGARRIYTSSFSSLAFCIGALPPLIFAARRVDLARLAIAIIQIISNFSISMASGASSIQVLVVHCVAQPSALSLTNSLAQMVATSARAPVSFVASTFFAAPMGVKLASECILYILLLGTIIMG
ncbi:major facilitator superfamily domain-containing protein, partial [Mycena capillaripes]